MSEGRRGYLGQLCLQGGQRRAACDRRGNRSHAFTPSGHWPVGSLARDPVAHASAIAHGHHVVPSANLHRLEADLAPADVDTGRRPRKPLPAHRHQCSDAHPCAGISDDDRDSYIDGGSVCDGIAHRDASPYAAVVRNRRARTVGDRHPGKSHTCAGTPDSDRRP